MLQTNGLTYQDSRMATPEEMKDTLTPVSLKGTGKAVGGPVLCREGDTVYVDGSDSHSIIVGDTGSMKTLRYVLPLIWSCAQAEESIVVVDPKGELTKKTWKHLKSKGYEVAVLDFRSPQKSPDKWNPLARIAEAYHRGALGKQEAILLLNDLTASLFYGKPAKDQYWNESAGQFFMGIVLLMLELEKQKDINMKNVLRWRYQNMLSGMLESVFQQMPTDWEAYQNLAGTLLLEAQTTKSCILSSFDQMLRLFKSAPALTDMLSGNTFDMRKLGSQKMAIFLVVPDEKNTFHGLATMFISQCYATLLEEAEKTNSTLPVRVNFVLEEFCNMPKLPELLPMLTAARSRNIRLHLVIQSYGQLEAKYDKEDSRAVLDNCTNLIYLHSREMTFLNYISELTGKNAYGRPLISASRLQRLQKNETLIFHDRCYPFLAKDVPLIFEYPIELGQTMPEKTRKRRLRRKAFDQDEEDCTAVGRPPNEESSTALTSDDMDSIPAKKKRLEEQKASIMAEIEESFKAFFGEGEDST